jgi:thiamine-phosphate pyrophosphorylase
MWLRTLPVEFHPRIVLHTHHDLANEFAVGGVHEREAGRAGPPSGLVADECPTGAPSGRALPRSRAVHDVATLRESLGRYDRLLVSPVFPSISKPGHAPDVRLDRDALRSALALPRRTEVIALGGIDGSRISGCRELGFDGVAVLGAIWQAADPLRAFHELSLAVAETLASH